MGNTYRAWISVVFSTWYGDCEALDEREEQVNFTLFLCVILNMNKVTEKSGKELMNL